MLTFPRSYRWFQHPFAIYSLRIVFQDICYFARLWCTSVILPEPNSFLVPMLQADVTVCVVPYVKISFFTICCRFSLYLFIENFLTESLKRTLSESFTFNADKMICIASPEMRDCFHHYHHCHLHHLLRLRIPFLCSSCCENIVLFRWISHGGLSMQDQMFLDKHIPSLKLLIMVKIIIKAHKISEKEYQNGWFMLDLFLSVYCSISIPIVFLTVIGYHRYLYPRDLF